MHSGDLFEQLSMDISNSGPGRIIIINSRRVILLAIVPL